MKPGLQLASSVCDTKVVVVRPPSAEAAIACGGVLMQEPGATATAEREGDPELMKETLLGKRYSDEATGLELLCVAGGTGSLTCNGVLMQIASAKPLPASD